MVSRGKAIYIREVQLFVAPIKDPASIKNASIARTTSSPSFRGAALAWYTAKLDDLHRLALRAGPGVRVWCLCLVLHTKLFKGSSEAAFTKLTYETYTIQDTQTGREPSGYVYGNALC